MRVSIIHKDSRYCALKFTRFWTEKNGTERYATYESYYQGDGSGDFSRNSVTKSEGVASDLPLKGPFRPFIYQPGKSYVECGPSKLVWEYKTKVGFGPPNKGRGAFGFELAPTLWIHVSQVNVLDARLIWYRDDEKRKSVVIPVEKLWEDRK
jgi:hypothetical protein